MICIYNIFYSHENIKMLPYFFLNRNYLKFQFSHFSQTLFQGFTHSTSFPSSIPSIPRSWEFYREQEIQAKPSRLHSESSHQGCILCQKKNCSLTRHVYSCQSSKVTDVQPGCTGPENHFSCVGGRKHLPVRSRLQGACCDATGWVTATQYQQYHSLTCHV